MLCAALVCTYGCVDEAPVSILPAHEGAEITAPTHEEETPAEEETPQPPPADTPENGGEENDEENGGEGPEEDGTAEPPAGEEQTVTVRFYSCEGEALDIKSYPLGTVLSQTDMPNCTAPPGYRCIWKIPSEALTSDKDCHAVRYEEISTASEFLAVSGERKYTLADDIDFSDVDTSARTVDEATGGLIAAFSGEIVGNGKTLSGLTVAGEAKSLFGALQGATIRGLSIEAEFSGKLLPAGGSKASACALIGKMTDGTLLADCRFTVRYSAAATEQNPSAGLVRLLYGGGFSNCELQVDAVYGDSASEHIYAACVWKHTSITFEGLEVAPTVTLSHYKDSSEFYQE